jgi:hypothetical protein
MMLSNRMTAKSLELKPARQASASTKNTMRLFVPTGFNRIEERDTPSMFTPLLGSWGKEVKRRRGEIK